MAKLLVQESSGVREFELVDSEIKVGRELDNVLRLADPSVSRHHAVIRKTATGYEIQDLGSSNGVLLNGAKVQTSPLQDGDRITLGQIQLTFVDPSSKKPEPSSPLGTVRINPEEMRRVQGVTQAGPAHPTGPVALASPPPPVQPPPRGPETQADAGSGLIVHTPGRGVDDSLDNPAPLFLQSWLPPIPDDAEPVMLGEAPERGDFLTRLVACLIDIAPMVAVVIIFQIVRFIVGKIPGLDLVLGCAATMLQAVFCLGYSFFFMPWCWSTFGATPGKRIMKLRVVPENDPYGRIDLGTAYLRLVGHICNCIVGYLLILGTERKAMQDYLSKSICIKVDQ